MARADYTPEERQAWRDGMRLLAKRLNKMTEGERRAIAGSMPIITCEGRAISLNNAAFLMLQAGDRDVTVIGGLRQWRRFGRRVRDGEEKRSIGYIWVPLRRRKRNGGDDTEDVETLETGPTRFGLVAMYDVTQTEDYESGSIAGGHVSVRATGRDAGQSSIFGG